MENTLNCKNNIVREFKSKKAAIGFIKRLIKGGYVKEANSSFFGFALNSKGKIYQVYEE